MPPVFSLSPPSESRRRQLCLLALGFGLLGLALLAWTPSFRGLSLVTADQVVSSFGLSTACIPHPSDMGWLGSERLSPGSATLFGSSVLQPYLSISACQLARITALQPQQTYLVLGLSLTALFAFISCRWAGFRTDTSLLSAFLMVTAPCSFSRLFHLELAVLIPVLPSLVACLQLQRALERPRSPLTLLAAGALAGLLTFPSQDYYVVFSLLLLLASFALLLLLASATTPELSTLLVKARRGGLFMLGFLLLLELVFLPRLLSLGLLPGTASGHAAGLMAGPPAIWSSPRQAVEQFSYGLLPFTWLIPSPWVHPLLELLRGSLRDTGNENYFWSTGSLLIPISWLVAIRRLAQSPRKALGEPSFRLRLRPPWPPLADGDRRFLAVLLLLASALGLLVMTMGGLGTLFAVFVSPVLRSLNRFTVFVYGASVLYLMADFDLWLQRRDPNP